MERLFHVPRALFQLYEISNDLIYDIENSKFDFVLYF